MEEIVGRDVNRERLAYFGSKCSGHNQKEIESWFKNGVIGCPDSEHYNAAFSPDMLETLYEIFPGLFKQHLKDQSLVPFPGTIFSPL